MNAQQYQRVTEVFDAAHRLEPARRDAYLADACRDEPDIRRAVERMLAQHDAPAFDLDSAAMSRSIDLPGLARSTDGAGDGAEPCLPRRIGPFTITGILGEGGMSIVYRAQQDFPHREVALKVLRGGAMSPAAMRRFRAEIETLAKLSHPNIAQVYQAGSYEEDGGGTGGGGAGGGVGGRPYFAMELVEGLTLTEYARTYRLSVPDRLRLMIDVCRAVQHAHLRGVIHRDLKPGNILVESRDGETEGRRDGVMETLHAGTSSLRLSVSSSLDQPKVLDFGIARATDLDVTRATLAAETGQIIGTLPYMSPEQLSGDAAAIDLRSDVYSLGVVLFELLAGELPHAISGEMSLPQTAQALLHNEPRRLGSVNRALRGELEVIAATAMEHDRARRYQSADALADDLRAYLDHRPIRARPPGVLLRSRKWLKRHPAKAATIGVVAIAMLLIASLLALQQQRARQAEAATLARLMNDARDAVQAYAGDLDASKRRETDLADVRNQIMRYNPPERALQLEQRHQQLLREQNEHAAAFHTVLDALGRAQGLGAPEEDVRSLLARLYLARVRETEAAGDRYARLTYLELVRQNDPDGELADEMLEHFPISVKTDRPGAEAHLFRLLEQSEIVDPPHGEPRLVAVPFQHREHEERGENPMPGQFALRIVNGKGALNDDDIVIAIGAAHAPIRDSVFVISAAPEHGLQPLDRLVEIDGREVRGPYDAYPPQPGVNAAAAASAPVKRTYVFQRAGDQTRVTFTSESLDALGIRADDAAAALHEAGGEARIWRRGEVVSMNLPPGLVFRTTAKPMFVSPQSLLGVTPIVDMPVERGRYVLLLLKDGFEPLRIPLEVDPRPPSMIESMCHTTWRMLPRSASPAPPGFVRACGWKTANPESFWIMEREVTLGEYLEFLNDPAILARIDASPSPTLYPRSGSLLECGREPVGAGSGPNGARLFTATPEMPADHPVYAVNWHDAMAYVRWRTERAHAAGEIPSDMEFDLPTHMQWLSAWGSSDVNQYPWGMHFRAYWTSSNYARQQPYPEPVMRFPIDESIVGVYDLAGSVSEWLNAWWIEERDQREVTGGSWGHGGGFNYTDMFMLYGQNGQTSTVTNGTVGFRLVLRKKA